MSRGFLDMISTDVESVLDLAPHLLNVTGLGARLELTGKGFDRVEVAGLARALLTIGPALLGIVVDAAGGSITVSGQLNWAASGADLGLRARTIAVTSGTSIDLGNGDLSLLASDATAPGRSVSSASVAVNGATLRGGNLVLSAESVADLLDAGQYASVVGSSTAAVSVLDSDLTSNGAVTLRAASSADARALATSLASHSDPRLDAATAAVVLASSAVSRIGGAGSVHAGGTLSLLASNLASASAVADASGSTAGAAIATLDVERTTRAVIEGPAGSVVAGGLDVVASSGGSLDVRAVGSAGGATLNGIAPGTLTGGLARTTQGLLPVASALGLGRLRGTTEAAVGGAGGLSVSSQNGVRVEGVTAGGLQVRADGSRTDGPGATAALALAGLTTRAALAGDLALTAPTVRVEANSTDLRTGARASARNAAADALSVTAAQIGTIADIAPAPRWCCRPRRTSSSGRAQELLVRGHRRRGCRTGGPARRPRRQEPRRHRRRGGRGAEPDDQRQLDRRRHGHGRGWPGTRQRRRRVQRDDRVPAGRRTRSVPHRGPRRLRPPGRGRPRGCTSGRCRLRPAPVRPPRPADSTSPARHGSPPPAARG